MWFSQGADQVTAICRTDVDPKLAETLQGTKPLSEAQKLRKVIMELIDTERAYVKVHIYMDYKKNKIYLCGQWKMKTLHSHWMFIYE